MSKLGTFYQSQADRWAAEAITTSLPLLREKCLRSQQAWQALADRVTSTEAIRDSRVEDVDEIDHDDMAPRDPSDPLL